MQVLYIIYRGVIPIKTWTKFTAGFLSALIFACVFTAVQMFKTEGKHYYAMGGIVTVVDKDNTDPERCSITIEQDGVGGRYTVKCTQEQYDAVRVGEEINCERWQSEVNHSGIVHGIKTLH